MPLIFKAVSEFPQLEHLHKDKASISQEGRSAPTTTTRRWSAGPQHCHLRAAHSGGQAWGPRGNAPDVQLKLSLFYSQSS